VVHWIDFAITPLEVVWGVINENGLNFPAQLAAKAPTRGDPASKGEKKLSFEREALQKFEGERSIANLGSVTIQYIRNEAWVRDPAKSTKRTGAKVE